MNTMGAIVIIEDDLDDQYFLEEAFSQLQVTNSRHYFTDAMDAYQYIEENQEQIFMIISDISLPKLNGLELHSALNTSNKLVINSIPYLFLSTSLHPQFLLPGRQISSQGLFLKPTSFQDIRELLDVVIKYWSKAATIGLR